MTLNLTVNSDGSGGEPSTNSTFARFTDLSGNGNHLTKLDTGAIYRTGAGANFIWPDSAPETSKSAFRMTGLSIPSQNFSGGMAIDCISANSNPLVDLADSSSPPSVNFIISALTDRIYGTIDTVTGRPGRKMVITWRGNASNTIVRIDGAEFTGTALTNTTLTTINLGRFENGGNRSPCRYYEVVIYDTDIGSSMVSELETSLRTNVGSYDANYTVATLGDSLSMGYAQTTLLTPYDYVTNRSNSRWYLFNAAGSGIVGGSNITAANMAALKGSTEGVCCLWIGTNNITPGVHTGATVEAALASYAGTLKSAGCKVIVCTLQHFPYSNAERINFNTLVKANYLTYADAIVKLDEVVGLDDATNTTYYQSDQLHLKDAGIALAGAAIQTAFAALA